MSSCCRARESDPDIELFETLEKVTFTLRRRDVSKDTTPLKKAKYYALRDVLLELCSKL